MAKEEPDRRVELMQLVHDTHQLVQRAETFGELTQCQAAAIYVKLALLNAKLREVPRG